jgi:aminopeptidase N
MGAPGVPAGRHVIVAAVVAVVTALAGCTGGPGTGTSETGRADTEFRPGAVGLGDPYFPAVGNGGYQVGHYHLRVRYDPATTELTGSATLTATATANLSAFSLDLSERLDVKEVTVDGAGAAAGRTAGDKLTVTPAAGLAAGEPFTVTVDYAGVPGPVDDPLLGSNGFHHTDDGAFVVGQPRSAHTWFPVNDHPRDKATYTIEATVPEGLVAVSNGVPEGEVSEGEWTTWTWSEGTPMASYLTMLAIGRYRLETDEHTDGRPVVTAVHAALPTSVDDQLRRSAEIADVLAGWFGPYPVDAYGGVVLTDDRVGFALETQSRPVYGPGFFRGGRDGTWVIGHELAHQWFGNSVTVHDWQQMWLNEGFATYAEWLWSEHDGGLTAQQSFDFFYDSAAADFWQVPPGDPGPSQLFHPAVYRRGAMTLHALRLAVGDDDFFRIVRAWTSEQRDGTGTTTQFVTLAERVSGESLGTLFHTWLHSPGRPERPTR